MNLYVLDADGNPVQEPDTRAAARWFESADRSLGSDLVGDVRISTVFLCFDHSWGRGPPMLWETMIFGGALDQQMERYTSRADALAGHQRWVEAVRNAAKVGFV